MTKKMEQRTPEWFDTRKGRITGSMVGAILDVAPYMTREQALRTMVRSYHGADGEFTGNIATEWGNNHEVGALWEYEMDTGNAVKPAFFDTKEDWLGASPDGYIGDDGLIEIKCPFGIRKDEIPKFKTLADQPHYYAQIQVQLYVTDRKWCDFWQWSPHGTSLERVGVDQQWIDDNMPVLRQFYAFYLSELGNPEHLGPLRKEVNTTETKRLLDEYDQLADAIANAQDRQKEVKEAIIAAASDHNALMWGRKVTKVQKQGSVSYAAIVKKHCKDVDLGPFRGKDSEYWKIT